jgi:hypothetical protein
MLFRSCSEDEHTKDTDTPDMRNKGLLGIPYVRKQYKKQEWMCWMFVRLGSLDIIQTYYEHYYGYPLSSSILHHVCLENNTTRAYVCVARFQKHACTATCARPKWHSTIKHASPALPFPVENQRMRDVMLRPTPQTYRGAVPVMRIIIIIVTITIGR